MHYRHLKSKEYKEIGRVEKNLYERSLFISKPRKVPNQLEHTVICDTYLKRDEIAVVYDINGK